MQTHFNLDHFKTTDPHVLAPGCDLGKVRFSDLNYTSRCSALLAATRDRKKPVKSADKFNELLNGRLSLAEVIARTE